MPGIEFFLVLAVALVVLVVAIAVRRVLLARNGGFSLCWRFTTTPDGQGWKFGQGRYEDRGLVLYRSFSPFPWPARILSRRQATLGERREPFGAETLVMPEGWVVQRCDDPDGALEIGLSEETLTGLRSWAESEPPRSRSIHRRNGA